MGKVYSGGFEFPTGVKRQASQPLDDSEIVEFLNDLKTLDKCYPLIIVGVLETETHYKWNGQDQTNLSNWTEVGASTTVNNTLTSDSTTEALSAAQGKVLKTLVNGKQAKRTTTVTTATNSAGEDITNAHHNKIVTITEATLFVTIDETNITEDLFEVEITTEALNTEIRFTGAPENLEYNSLTDSKIVFTDRNMSVIIFKNDASKFCWRVVGSTLPVQLTSENIVDIVEGAGFSSYPKPYFNNLSPLSVPPTQSRTITINGAFFKEPVENMLARFVRYSQEPLLDANGLPIHDETKVIRELQVNSLTFINDSSMEVNITGVNIHDTATHGTDAFELDGTTEINNVYWLLLHNGATRIFSNAFTVSYGDIYIPKAGLTTDIPAGDWEHISGIGDITKDGVISPISENTNYKYNISGIPLPASTDFRLKFQVFTSQYEASAPTRVSDAIRLVTIDDISEVYLDVRGGLGIGLNNTSFRSPYNESFYIERSNGIISHKTESFVILSTLPESIQDELFIRVNTGNLKIEILEIRIIQ
ncbi:hypothetical protein [Wenyingzhuangia aestuarii]|uniref:hypothetical protein n=1 Tax=Wenyingzhuangia aestuarii TaxID=1647582 RepID=UPI001439B3FB|nr:hypothetical protein [Wenyingzhuangia aestuarii]NJB83605.1 hypothetical protein [Wenyingzhuangia aestuarii]